MIFVATGWHFLRGRSATFLRRLFNPEWAPQIRIPRGAPSRAKGFHPKQLRSSTHRAVEGAGGEYVPGDFPQKTILSSGLPRHPGKGSKFKVEINDRLREGSISPSSVTTPPTTIVYELLHLLEDDIFPRPSTNDPRNVIGWGKKLSSVFPRMMMVDQLLVEQEIK